MSAAQVAGRRSSFLGFRGWTRWRSLGRRPLSGWWVRRADRPAAGRVRAVVRPPSRTFWVSASIHTNVYGPASSLLYTGVTRAKRLVVLAGSAAPWPPRYAPGAPGRRHTALAHRLQPGAQCMA